MIAFINGITVQGSPEEIERYRQLTAEKKTSTDFFNSHNSDIPEHVKKYGKNTTIYQCKETKVRAWF